MRISLACLVLLCASMLSAQVSNGFTGTISDPTGAAVSAAAVTVKNTDTGALRSATTDDGGLYQVTGLPVGEYEIRVKKMGFKEAIRTGVHLAVAQNATVDMSLAV